MLYAVHMPPSLPLWACWCCLWVLTESPCPGLQKVGPRLSAAVTSPAAPLLPSSTGGSAAGATHLGHHLHTFPTPRSWIQPLCCRHHGSGVQDALCLFLLRFSFKISVVSLTETWSIWVFYGSTWHKVFLSSGDMKIGDSYPVPDTNPFLHRFPGFLALQKPNVFFQRQLIITWTSLSSSLPTLP